MIELHDPVPSGCGKEILRILESSAAKGRIELLYTRRPDAYDSYKKDYGEARIFASSNGGRMVGTCAELIREVYIGGKPAKAAYICGLKKDADYTGGVSFGVNFIRSLQRDDIDIYYYSVIADNRKAASMFEKKSRLISATPLTEYTTFIISSKLKLKAANHDLMFRQASCQDTPQLIAFLNDEGKKKDFFPVITSLSQFHHLTYKDFYLLIKNDRIVAAAALWNQTEYKQYVVKQYRGIMQQIRILNPLLSLLGYIKLPKENTPLVFPMLSFFLCQDDNETYYKTLLSHLLPEIRKKYDLFVIGLPKNHFASSLLHKLPNIHFDTKLYALSFPWSSRTDKKVDTQHLYPECGLL